MKKYLITSDITYKLREKLLKHKPNFVLYRDKSNINYKTHAEKFLNICREFKDIKVFLHQDVQIAVKLKADGIHLTSLAFDDIKKAKELGLEVVTSTHSKEEVLKVQELGANYVTYSPIFTTPNKGQPKGIQNLKEILKVCKIKLFALGGIVDEEQIKEVAKTNVYGFASIRYFE